MDPATGAALGQVASSVIGGAMQNSAFSGASMKERKFAREQMRWQQNMRATAYQTAVEDLKKAGLNPALAYSQGPSSAPGASGSASVTPETGIADAVTNSVGKAVATKLQTKQLDQADATLDATKAEANLKNAQATTAVTQNTLMEKDIPQAEAHKSIMETLMKTGRGILERIDNSAKSLGRDRAAEDALKPKWKNGSRPKPH